MCARYELSSNANNLMVQDLMEQFGLEVPPPLPNRPEVRPTDVSLVFSERGPESLPWGPKAPWDGPQKGKPLINARAETLGEKATFRGWLKHRCLVPASAYFEWRKAETGEKHKNRITLDDVAILAFAGLIQRSDTGAAFTIITCSPAKDIAHIHNRMPVILSQDAQQKWLEGGIPFEAVHPLLRPTNQRLAAEEETPPRALQGDLFT